MTTQRLYGRGARFPAWTGEETAFLRDNYETLTAPEIAAHLGRSVNAIHVRANILGLRSRHRSGMASLVPGYFKVIDTPMKAYLLGLLAADGFISGKNQLCLALRDYDKSAVELLRDELAPRARLASYLTREGNEMVLFRVQSADLAADVAAHGIVPSKSLITRWPEHLPYEFENSYVGGYFDGDGSVIRTWPYRWTVVSGNPDFLKVMQKRIRSHTGIAVGGPYQDRRAAHAWSICQTCEPVRALDGWTHRDVPGLARKRMIVTGQDEPF